ncbi:MAG: hypothetical protein WKF61_02980, partial [Luteimonas sp.]
MSRNDAVPAALAAMLAVMATSICMTPASASVEAGPQTPPPQTSPYQDRIIAPQALAALPPDDDEDVDTDGLPRAIRLELNVGQSARGDDTSGEQGLSAGGFWETADWGSFSLDATVFHSDRDRLEFDRSEFDRSALDRSARDRSARDRGLGGAATLWQRNLFVDGGWRVDNGLGVLNTPSPGLQREQYRFFLPTVSFAGVSTQWAQDERDVAGHAAFGRAGIYNGTRVVGFDLADGHVAAVGAQWRWAPGWTGAASYLGTQGRIVPDQQGEATLIDGSTHAAHLTSAWQSVRSTVQLNLLGSDTERGRAQGAWVDTSARRGRYRHNYGVFSLDPELAWGALPINNDVRGGYYRVAYQFARWTWNLGLDDIRSISGNGFDGQYATGFLRYQSSSRLGYGGSLNVRRTPDITYSAQLFADRRTAWGQTRVQFDHADGGDGSGRSWL